MGMPKTKADCDREIAYLKDRIEKHKEELARAKARPGNGFDTRSVQGSCKDEIERCKKKIKALQEHKKTLK